VRNIFWMPADGSTLEAERLLNSPNLQYPGSWSEDDELIFVEVRAETGDDILVVPIDGEREPRVVLATEYDEHSPRLSPNGQWLAYVSNSLGGEEIWAQPYPAGTPRRISTKGGRGPVWARDGEELFYLEGDPGDPDCRLMGVTVNTGPGSSFGPPQVLVDGGFVMYVNVGLVYDVGADGRFLMIQATEDAEEERDRIEVVLNWFEELKRQVPAD